ncbi:hypothetical protein ACIF85_43615 [Streptomyces sp. NPDC086033]|uniref:hypothetical protein n=1 Tax=Streptomyces sp. NPDC086033 TaxID=3365747 RepID=UPI0037CE1D89
MIDTENLLYTDVEGEYQRSAVDGLDEDRLALYKLTQRLPLTAGPLRLIDGDFPDREFLREIDEYHLDEALALAAV